MKSGSSSIQGPKSGAAASRLSALERLRLAHGDDAAAQKLAILSVLRSAPLKTARQVLRLHECLCFLLVFPDDARVRVAAERMLATFAYREDLVRHREALADSGIAGTSIHFSFYYPTARWLARRWSRHLHIDWSAYEHPERIDALIPMLLPAAESLMFDGIELATRELVDAARAADETDATFVLRRFETLRGDEMLRQHLFEDLELPMFLTAGRDTPSRSAAKIAGFEVSYAPPRPAGRDWRRQAPLATTVLSPRRGRKLVDCGRIQMITRGRDLYAFMSANAHDVRIYDMGEGLCFAALGLLPARRYILETMYVYLAIHNGVPIGYVQSTSLFRSAEINFNIFDSFRSAFSSRVFTAVLAMVRATLGCDTFIINTQQLGEGNEEAIRTGAFWFYHKHGFRPREHEVVRLMQTEERRKTRNRGHRSSPAVLRGLAGDHLYLALGRPRAATVSTVRIDRIGLAVSRYLAARFGADRESGIRICALEAARRLGLRSLDDFSRAEREAWQRWSPLVLMLPALAKWSAAERRALVKVIRSKGGIHEGDYLQNFHAHPRLSRAIVRMAAQEADR